MCLTPSQQKVKTWTRSRSEMPCTVNGFQCHIETSPRRQDLGTTGAPGKIETWIRATYIGIRICHLCLYEYICMYVEVPSAIMYARFKFQRGATPTWIMSKANTGSLEAPPRMVPPEPSNPTHQPENELYDDDKSTNRRKKPLRCNSPLIITKPIYT